MNTIVVDGIESTRRRRRATVRPRKIVEVVNDHEADCSCGIPGRRFEPGASLATLMAHEVDEDVVAVAEYWWPSR
jgi:hypothetical protein